MKKRFCTLYAVIALVLSAPAFAQVPAGGDLCGNLPGPNVCGLQGKPIATATPGTGNTLQYGGSSWAPTAPAYDVGTPILITPAANQTVQSFVFDRTVTFPASLTGSQGYIKTAPSGVSGETFTLYKNGTSFGTASFAQSATTATFTAASAVTFNAGDLLTIVETTSPADSAFAAPGCITLMGTR